MAPVPSGEFGSETNEETFPLAHQWAFLTTLKYLKSQASPEDIVTHRVPSDAEQVALAHCLSCLACNRKYNQVEKVRYRVLFHTITTRILPFWHANELKNPQLQSELYKHLAECEQCALIVPDEYQRTILEKFDVVSREVGTFANHLFNLSLLGDNVTRELLNRWLGKLSDSRQRLLTVEVCERVDNDVQKTLVLTKEALKVFDEAQLQGAAIATLRPFSHILRETLHIVLLENTET
jgi:hypothetical protein